MASIDTLKELSTLVERLKSINSLLLSGDSMALVNWFSSYRTDLIRIREMSKNAIPFKDSTIQTTITRFSEIESRLLGSTIDESVLTTRKRQNLLKTTNSCMDDLHALVQKIQSNII